MNIEQANQKDLYAILEKIGCKPVRRKGHDIWYHSPFRDEKTASFHIHTAQNIWYDFGLAKGGNVIDFVCAYLESQNEDHTLVDALRWLVNMQPAIYHRRHAEQMPVQDITPLRLRKVSVIQHYSLLGYLRSRGIDQTIARRYMREVKVLNKNTGNTMHAIGLANENGGYELRNEFFKGCLGSKSISFVRGAMLLPDEVHIFEGGMDFLSALHHQKGNRFQGDAIILNSTACLSQAFPYIRNYSYKTVYSWLDNDNAGQKAADALRHFIKHEPRLSLKSMNTVYAPFKDVNEWHMQKM